MYEAQEHSISAEMKKTGYMCMPFRLPNCVIGFVDYCPAFVQGGFMFVAINVDK